MLAGNVTAASVPHVVIRNLLPEKVIHFAFAKLARIVRRQARPSGSTDMSPEDFFVSPEPIDRALDLVAICSRA